MIFSTSNQETEISAEKQEVYFKKSDIVDLIIDFEENDGTIDSRVLLEKLRELPRLSAEGDLISRKAVLEIFGDIHPLDYNTRAYVKQVEELPTIPQTDYANYEAFGWCKGCKEYDTKNHCCHRYSSFIRESLQDSIGVVLEDIKEEIGAKVFDISSKANGKYFDGVDDVMNIIDGIIDKHISRKE